MRAADICLVACFVAIIAFASARRSALHALPQDDLTLFFDYSPHGSHEST